MKTPQDSITESSFLARPENANTIGTVFGGDILLKMDEAAAICARRHSGLRVATVAVRNVNFEKAIIVGQVIKITAVAARTFNTSMFVDVTVWAEDTYHAVSYQAASAHFIIVCMDDSNKPASIPELKPVSAQEVARWEQAGRLKEQKL